MVQSTSSNLQKVGTTLVTYLKAQFPAFQPFSLGNVCTATGVGFWYMTGDDCGAFSEMGSIFTDLTNAERHFNAAKDKFSTCVSRTGLLNFPTPFLSLNVNQFCLPRSIVAGVEYLIGAVVYTTNELTTLFTSITSVLKNFVDSKLSLLQLGTVLAQGRLDSNSSKLATVSPQCGTNNNWGLDIMVSFSVATNDGTAAYEFGFGIGVSLGCQSGRMMAPNALIAIGLAYGFTTADVGSGAGVDLSLTFTNSFQSFGTSRTPQIQAYLVVEPEIDLEDIVGVPAAVSFPIGFGILPQQSTPSGFFISIAAEVLASSMLSQLGADVSHAASKATHDTAGTDPTTRTVAAIAAAAQQLAGPNGLEKALAQATPDHERILKKASLINEHKESIVQAARDSHDKEGPVSMTVKSELEFLFCITPVSCS